MVKVSLIYIFLTLEILLSVFETLLYNYVYIIFYSNRKLTLFYSSAICPAKFCLNSDSQLTEICVLLLWLAYANHIKIAFF